MADVASHHPDFDEISDDWLVVRDAIAGESPVKWKAETYLPMPSGFTTQEDGGAAFYAAYILRGKFPEIMGPTLRGMVGIIHRIEADVELPAKLEPLRESCTLDGLPLSALHERVTYELLASGRYGLLVDLPTGATVDNLPYIAGYKAETIINWSLDKDFYVLDETHLERDGFAWNDVEQYRVLELEPEPDEEQGTSDLRASGASPGDYVQTLWTVEEGKLAENEPVVPQMTGGGHFTEIPFTVIGSTDIGPELDEIPLIGVARCAFNMYRLDTDYKHQLYMSGQDTLFVYADSDQPVGTVGAGVVITLPAGSKAEYAGPIGKGIDAHKVAIDDERTQAMIAGARLFDTERKAQESGEALKMRWSAQTASLTSVAINSAKGLEQALKYCAEYVGANPDEVVVTPNLRFVDTSLPPDKAKFLMDLWMGGAISKQTLDANLQRGDIRDYDRSFEEEQNLIDQEIPDITTPTLAIEDQRAQDTHDRAKEMASHTAQLKPKPVAKKK